MTFKLGRKRPIARGPRLAFGNYLLADLPKPPLEMLYGAKANLCLSQMFLNDQLGDCVEAAMFHCDGVLEANAGRPIVFTDADVEKVYEVTGYVPGDPATDQGSDEQTMLNWWQKNGLLPDGSHKIAGWAALTGSNRGQVETAIWLFENCLFGVELPDEWVNNMPSASGFMWDVAGPANPNNGHAFIGFGYGPSGVKISTWGMWGEITWAAVAKYASTALSGELYTVLSSDALATASTKAPAGFDLTQLMADIQAIGHGA